MTRRHKNPDGLHNALDDESFLLDFFRTGFESQKVLIVPEDDEAEATLHSILNETGWADCTSIGEGMPDFINDDAGLMIEMMRVDDHEREGSAGSRVNPQRAEEGKVLKDLDGKLRELLDAIGGGRSILMNVSCDLPGEEFRDYGFYLESFCRIVGKHAAKVDGYRMKNPGKKLIFFVFDESAAYFVPSMNGGPYLAGDEVGAELHWHFLDAAFIDAVRECGADYLLWFTPFKHVWLADDSRLNTPTACLFDCDSIDFPLIDYVADRVVCAEE